VVGILSNGLGSKMLLDGNTDGQLVRELPKRLEPFRQTPNAGGDGEQVNGSLLGADVKDDTTLPLGPWFHS
jgi:hypothetical protein